MTRPCVVLYDWSGDDEATVHVNPLEHGVTPEPPGEGLDDFDPDQFRPRWRGAGRRPGAAILTGVLGLCVVIGFLALFAPAEEQASLTTPAPATLSQP